MKNALKNVAALIVIAVALSGCQKPKNSTRITSNGLARSNGVTPGTQTLSNGITLNGTVRTSSNYQNDFQEGVRDLLEATVPRDYVGTVMADGSGNTGVWFGGKVELSNGQRIGVSNGQVQIATNSEIYIAVYDSYYTAQNLDPIPGIYLKSASGYVNGNNVYIKFSDSYGYVELVGQFDNSTFRGDFKYKTERTHNGEVGYSGTLGGFSVPPCQFFRCN